MQEITILLVKLIGQIQTAGNGALNPHILLLLWLDEVTLQEQSLKFFVKGLLVLSILCIKQVPQDSLPFVIIFLSLISLIQDYIEVIQYSCSNYQGLDLHRIRSIHQNYLAYVLEAKLFHEFLHDMISLIFIVYLKISYLCFYVSMTFFFLMMFFLVLQFAQNNNREKVITF